MRSDEDGLVEVEEASKGSEEEEVHKWTFYLFIFYTILLLSRPGKATYVHQRNQISHTPPSRNFQSWNQCFGSIYVFFVSGSRFFFQYGSGSRENKCFFKDNNKILGGKILFNQKSRYLILQGKFLR